MLSSLGAFAPLCLCVSSVRQRQPRCKLRRLQYTPLAVGKVLLQMVDTRASIAIILRNQINTGNVLPPLNKA